MRVLVVGEFAAGQTGYYCARALRSLRVDTALFDVAGYPAARWRASPSRLLPILAHFMQVLWANGFLARTVERVHPAVILVLGGRDIRLKTLERIRRTTRAQLFNWNTDNPLNPVNSSPDLLRAIPLFDCYFAWGKFLIPELTRLGARRVDYLPFCFDPETHRPVALDRHETLALGNDVVFAGTWEPQREAYLNHVVDYDLGIWGNHWHRLARNSGLQLRWRGLAEDRELARVLSASKIALNFIRGQNGPAHNLRTFEVPACGTFLLSTRTEEQRELLGEDRGAAFFSSPEEMRDKIDFFLRNSAQRQKIAAQGRAVIAKGNTYQDRMRQILQVAEQSMPGTA